MIDIEIIKSNICHRSNQLYSVALEWPLLLGLSNSTCIKHCYVVPNEWTNACLSLHMKLSLYSLF